MSEIVWYQRDETAESFLLVSSIIAIGYGILNTYLVPFGRNIFLGEARRN